MNDERPAQRLAQRLRDEEEPLDGVMIGWGVRGTPALSPLLEECVEAVRDNTPSTTKYLFSTTPSDHLATIYRRFPHVDPKNIKS